MRPSVVSLRLTVVCGIVLLLLLEQPTPTLGESRVASLLQRLASVRMQRQNDDVQSSKSLTLTQSSAGHQSPGMPPSDAEPRELKRTPEHLGTVSSSTSASAVPQDGSVDDTDDDDPAKLSPEPLPPLPADMANHTFVFVVGHYHTGTTLTDVIIGSHPDGSKLTHTHVVMDEGQHLQHVYPPAKDIGHLLMFHKHPMGRLLETSHLVTEENRRSLFDSWSPFWDLSHKVLVEKSPRHITMTRFLQTMFGADTSAFLGVMRHPIGTFHFFWKKNPASIGAHCAGHYVRAWLEVYEMFHIDAQRLRNVKVFQIEQLLETNQTVANNMVANMYKAVGIDPSFTVDVDSKSKEEVGPQNMQGPQHAGARVSRRAAGRKLLGYWGGARDAKAQVHMGSSMSWVDQYLDFVGQPACQRMIDMYESQVNEFGYSLKEPRRIFTPSKFKDMMLSID